jgi:type IV secretion system protein VirB8
VPIPILIHDDGSTEIAWSWRDVMAENKAAVVTGALWFYVRSREGYNWTDARQNYEAVGAMSAASVRDGYQRAFLPSNPESPQVKIGRRGHVSLQYDGSVLSRDAPEARIFFWRTLQMDGAAPQKTHWTVTLEYRVNEPVPGFSRLFNPEGIVVTSYSVQEDSPR